MHPYFSDSHVLCDHVVAEDQTKVFLESVESAQMSSFMGCPSDTPAIGEAVCQAQTWTSKLCEAKREAAIAVRQAREPRQGLCRRPQVMWGVLWGYFLVLCVHPAFFLKMVFGTRCRGLWVGGSCFSAHWLRVLP